MVLSQRLELLEEQQRRIADTIKEVREEMEKPKQVSVRRRADVGHRYWTLSDLGRVINSLEKGDSTDDRRFDIGNYYITFEVAKKARDRQLAYVRIVDALREAEGDWVVDWGDDTQWKFNPTFCHDSGLVVADCWVSTQGGPSEFISSESVWDAVIASHESDLRLWFEVEG